jgi:hypothetical protein
MGKKQQETNVIGNGVIANSMALEELNLPGFDFHPSKGKPQRYSIPINGLWRMPFVSQW